MKGPSDLIILDGNLKAGLLLEDNCTDGTSLMISTGRWDFGQLNNFPQDTAVFSW